MKLKGLTILFFTLLVGLVFLADTRPWLFTHVYQIPLGDKVGHFMLMGTLAFLVNMTWPQKWGSFWFRGTPLVCTLVLLEEISQIWLPVRTFSMGDLIFDLAGIILLGELLPRRLLDLRSGWWGRLVQRSAASK